MVYRPPFVSEREGPHTWADGRLDDSHWEDCAWTSALMLANATTGGRFPATLTEAELARATVMGPLGGTAIGQLQAGVLSRWKLTPTRVNSDTTTFPQLWAALAPGKGAVVMGVLAGLPDGHRLRRWQPTYLGGHAVYVQREADEGRVWWMDPLATTGYVGEWATAAELQSYYDAFRVVGAGQLIASIYAGDEDVIDPVTDIPPSTAKVLPGFDLYDAPTAAAPIIVKWAGGDAVGVYAVAPAPRGAALRVNLGSTASPRYIIGWIAGEAVVPDAPAGDTTAAYNAGVDAAAEAAKKAKK